MTIVPLYDFVKVKMTCYLSVQFSGGCISPLNVNNPNNLTSDHEDKTFNCFTSAQVKFLAIFLFKLSSQNQLSHDSIVKGFYVLYTIHWQFSTDQESF